jgi:hypothetical protein
MSEKITLTRYLKGRGEVKALTHIEALAFGVPYPLQPGWPAKYGATEITAAMIEDLKARIATAKESTASKARRGLEGLERRASASAQRQEDAPAARVSPVAGFVLRQARRYRKQAPWA